MLINALERTIEDCILETWNERGEDSRTWMFMYDLNFDKKIDRLKSLYKEYVFHIHENNKTLLAKISTVFTELNSIRKERNTFIHSNWLNNQNLKHFELKVKEVTHLGGYYRIRKSIKLKDLDIFIKNIEKTSRSLGKLHAAINQID